MLNLLIIILGISGLFCLYLTVACIIAASREFDFPDIEDVEAGDIN